MMSRDYVINIRHWSELEELVEEATGWIAETVPEGSTIAINPKDYESTGATYRGKELYWRRPSQDEGV